MIKLLIKTKDGKIIKGRQSLHILLCIDNNIDINDVIACGIVTKGNREIWDDRSPD